MNFYPFHELTVTFLIIGEGSELTVAKLFEPYGIDYGCIELFFGKVYANK